MRIFNKKFLMITLIAFALLSAGAVLAQGATSSCGNTCPGGSICIPNPLKYCSFEDLINKIVDFFFYVSVALTPFMIILGAFYILTSGGSPDRVKTGQQIILYTLIGFAVILLAKGFISVLNEMLR